jgi:hypothetical protein
LIRFTIGDVAGWCKELPLPSRAYSVGTGSGATRMRRWLRERSRSRLHNGNGAPHASHRFRPEAVYRNQFADWQISKIGNVARFIGTVQATDAEATLRRAIEKYHIAPEHQSRIAARQVVVIE